jgi:hypothetical protein
METLPGLYARTERNDLFWLNQESTARILDHFVRTAILYFERLNREHKQAIAQIPSVRNVPPGIPHGHLLEFGKVSMLPFGSVFLDQALPEVFPLGIENFLEERKLPPFLALDKAKSQFAFFKLASEFVSKAIPANRAFDKLAIPFLVNLDKVGLAQLSQNHFTAISSLQVRINESGSQVRHRGGLGKQRRKTQREYGQLNKNESAEFHLLTKYPTLSEAQRE